MMPDVLASLEERIDVAIHRNPHLNCRQLTVDAKHGRVVLHGVVRTYYQKQMAQETAWSVEGVDAVDNQVEVDWHIRRRAK